MEPSPRTPNRELVRLQPEGTVQTSEAAFTPKALLSCVHLLDHLWFIRVIRTLEGAWLISSALLRLDRYHVRHPPRRTNH